MDPGLYIDRITDDESLAGDLDEADAATLVKTLVEIAKHSIATVHTEEEADDIVSHLRQRGKTISRIVAAWRDDGPDRASQTAVKFGMPTPPDTLNTSHDLLSFYLDFIQQS